MWEQQYSKFTAMLPTRAFLAPMDEDEEIEVELSKGNSVIIKYKALSELQPNGKRCDLCSLPDAPTLPELANDDTRCCAYSVS